MPVWNIVTGVARASFPAWKCTLRPVRRRGTQPEPTGRHVLVWQRLEHYPLLWGGEMIEFSGRSGAISISQSVVRRPIEKRPSEIFDAHLFLDSATTRTRQLRRLQKGTEPFAHRRELARPPYAITWEIVDDLHYVRRSLSSTYGVEARWSAGDTQRGLFEEG